MNNAEVCARKLLCGTWELNLNVDKEVLQELEKHCGNKSIVAQPDSDLLLSSQQCTILPLCDRITMEKLYTNFYIFIIITRRPNLPLLEPE